MAGARLAWCGLIHVPLPRLISFWLSKAQFFHHFLHKCYIRFCIRINLKKKETQALGLCIWRWMIIPVCIFCTQYLFWSGQYSAQSNLYLRTQLVKNGCTYCKKYSNRGMDSHRLTCEVVQLANDLQKKKKQKFDKPLKLHVKGFNWSMTFSKKNSRTS